MNFMWFSYGDPDVLRTLFHSANVNAFNRARYQVPEVDRILQEAAAATDKARRAALYSRIQQRVLRDAVCVPLVDTLTYNAKRAEVEGDSIDALASYVWLYDIQIKR
jgi:ABC-type transport system substrate-binding protein